MHLNKITPVSIALIVRNVDELGFDLWVQKRTDENKKELDGKWEFPGGKWMVDEGPEEACKREVLEETGVSVSRSYFFKDYMWTYSDRSVNLHVYLVADLEMPIDENRKWMRINTNDTNDQFFRDIPAVNKEIVIDFENYLKKAIEDKNWEKLWER